MEERSVHHDRVQWARHLAETRLDKDLRGLACAFENHLQTQVLRQELDEQARVRQEWLLSLQMERAQELERRLYGPARARQATAQAGRERLRLEAEAEQARKDREVIEKQLAFDQVKLDEAGKRAAEAEAREAYGRLAAARAQALEIERAADELRRQESVAQRRAEVMAAIAEAQRRAAEARRERAEALQAQLRANEQRFEEEQWHKETRLDAKLARVTRMVQHREEVMSQVRELRDDTAATRAELWEIYQEASMSNNFEPLLQRVAQLGLGHRIRQPSVPHTPPPRPPPSARRRQASSAPRPRPRSANPAGRAPASQPETPTWVPRFCIQLPGDAATGKPGGGDTAASSVSTTADGTISPRASTPTSSCGISRAGLEQEAAPAA